jgi:hypothetical protein
VGSVVISGITFVQMVRSLRPGALDHDHGVGAGLSALGAVLLLGEPLGWNLLAGWPWSPCRHFVRRARSAAESYR